MSPAWVPRPWRYIQAGDVFLGKDGETKWMVVNVGPYLKGMALEIHAVSGPKAVTTTVNPDNEVPVLHEISPEDALAEVTTQLGAEQP